MKELNIQKHILVPKHTILGDKETQELLSRYNVSKKQLPTISIKDPAIEHLDVKLGDIIHIIRNSPTQGTAPFYRLVV
mgnify:CR=1 FL=1